MKSDHTQDDQHIPKSFDEIQEDELEIPKWQLSHLKKRLMGEVEEEIEEEMGGFKLVDNADSQIQSIIKNIYETLEGGGSPDRFDCFYENSEIEDYSRKDLIAEFIKEVMDSIELRSSDVQELNEVSIEKLKTQEGMDKSLKAIAESVGEGDTNLSRIEEIIEDQYPELLQGDSGVMDADEYKAKQESFIEEELIKSVYGIEPKEKFKEYFEEFRALNNNDVEDIAVKLDNTIDIGVDVWKLLIYSTLSPHSEKFELNGRKTRASLHTLLIGEISTAKSGILSIINDISPQADQISDMTKASFIGAYDNSEDEIQDGIVDRIIDGNMLIEEYDKIDTADGLMRVVFDNSSISVSKGQDTKSFESVPTSIIAGANPKQDFFIQGDNMRSQIPFKEGELSRFDITVPLINTQEDMEKITDEMEIFGGGSNLDMNEVSDLMNQLSTRIQEIESMEFEDTPGEQPSLQVELKEAFKSLQKTLETKNRQELLIMRDFETLIRLVNIIGRINEPIEDGKITISQGTVQEAVAQFETLIDLRKRLYTSDEREVVNMNSKGEIEQKLIELTGEGDSVKQNKLKDECMKAGIVNNKATFYNKVDDLINEERAKYKNPEKDRYKEIQPLAQ